MRKKNGFVISTTLYSVFGIMLLIVFYILYALSNNRYIITGSVNEIKDKFSNIQNSSLSSEYKDTSGANKPILASGMIPVVYDETNNVWVKADLHEKWYDYNEQWWANAVTVESTNSKLYTYLSNEHIGKEIPMDEINSMWVWIPRFKYNIPSALGSASTIQSPPIINVQFETDTKITGVTEKEYRNGIASGALNSLEYTHPAFRNKNDIEYGDTSSWGAWDKELTGFWVSKFEVGTTNLNYNCIYEVTKAPSNRCFPNDINSFFDSSYGMPLIKPNLNPLTNQDLIDAFKTSLIFSGRIMDDATGNITYSGPNRFGLSTNNDSHMMKNTEWGAVAILSQSQYGKKGNSDYTETNKNIYFNPSRNKTGASSCCTSTNPSCSNIGTYEYNDIVDRTNGKGACGAGASTTGNIYGIYDMAGGLYDYTFSLRVNTSQNVVFGYSEIQFPDNFPDEKYYDYYHGPYGANKTATVTKENIILGDATWETMQWGLSTTDENKVIGNLSFNRGGLSDSSGGNIFRWGGTNGDYTTLTSVWSYSSFHVTLMPNIYLIDVTIQ